MVFLTIFFCILFNMILNTTFNLVNKYFSLNTSIISLLTSIILMIIMLIAFNNLKEKNVYFKKSITLLFFVVLINIFTLIFPNSQNDIQTITPLKFLSLILSLAKVLCDIYFYINTSLGISDLCTKCNMHTLKLNAEKQTDIFRKVLIGFILLILILPFIGVVLPFLVLILTILFATFIFYVQIKFLILIWNSHKLFDNK